MPSRYPEHRPCGLTLKEADTCRIYITPALVQAGWGDPRWRIKEQHCFTDGQVVLVGNGHKRLKKKKADYLLRYQESFPIAVVEAILKGQSRILINLATGTGKTLIAFQAAWKLWQARWNVAGKDRPPRILFLADRNVLRDQAYNTFEPFEKERDTIAEGKAPMNRSIYFGIYQAMYSDRTLTPTNILATRSSPTRLDRALMTASSPLTKFTARLRISPATGL